MTIPHLHSVAPPAEPIDLARAKARRPRPPLALGCDLDDESCARRRAAWPRPTPSCSPRAPFNPTTFPNDEGYDELVVARDIPFHSLCEHHLLPFHGVAHVGYLPGERIVGLSKLARVVELFARGLQVQERLTTQVAAGSQTQLGPAGRRRRARGRAPVHVAARRAEARRADRHVRTARRSCATIRGLARSSSP